MAKYLVETYYTCSFKVNHYLDDISQSKLENLEKREDGKFEILDIKLDNRKTKNLETSSKKNIPLDDIKKDEIKTSNNIVSKNVHIIETDHIFDLHYDIFSPCALGGVISMDNLKKLNCKIIAGAANNQLEDDINVPNEILKKDILYFHYLYYHI